MIKTHWPRSRWLRYAIALVAGALLTLAFAPFFLLPVVLLSMGCFLLLACRADSKKQAFLLGFLFGFGHHVTALYWIANSMRVDAERFGWMIPFAMTLVPAILSLYIGLVAVIVRAVPLRGWALPPLAALCWVGAEYARGYIPAIGFPWNLLGYSFIGEIHLAQSGHLVGIWGLSFLAAWLGFLPVLMQNRKQAILVVAVMLAVLGAMAAYGDYRLGNAPQSNTAKPVTLRLVQANLPQMAALTPEQRFAVVQKHIEMTNHHLQTAPNLVIWSESSIPFALNLEPELRELISKSLPERSILLSGAMRVAKGGKQVSVYNSIFALQNGTLLTSYDKHNLVPFGEFVPFRTVLPFVEKLADGMGDFSRGPGPVSMGVAKGLPFFSPMICYEVIFSGEVVAKGKPAGSPPPSWILNLTNDAWFGDSIGPQQHLAMARMRAIEEGIPLIRAAGTGVSAVVDAYGRILQQLPLNREGIIDAVLPPPAAH